MRIAFHFVNSRLDKMESQSISVVARKMMTDCDVNDALSSVAEARKRLAVRATWPLRRHAAGGAIIGLMVAGTGVPFAARMFIICSCLFAAWAIKDYDRRHDGFFVSGYKAGRTRWVALLILLLSIGAIFGSLYAKQNHGWLAAPFVSGIMIFFAATYGSIWWERFNQADLAGNE